MARGADDAPVGFELVAPRPDAFGPAAGGAGDTDDTDGARPTSRRRRRITAGFGTLAAIGVVAAMVSPNDDGATSLPSPATAAVPSSTSPDDTDPATAGYLIDPEVATAAGFTPLGGLSPRDPSDELAGRLRLWITPGATRTTGTWVAVQRSPEPLDALQDAARVTVGDTVGLLVVEPDGIATLATSSADGGSLVLTSRGFVSSDLRALAAELRTVAPEDEAGTIAAHRAAGNRQLLGLVIDRDSIGMGLTPDVLTTGVTSSAFYRDEAGRFVSITTSALDPERDGVLAPFVLRDLRFTARGERELASGAVGLPDHPLLGELHVISWTEDGVTVRVASTRSDVDLAALAAGARAGSDDEWRAVQARARGFVGGRNTQYAPAAAGELDDGSTWTVDIADGPSWANLFVSGTDGTAATAELYLDRTPCASITSATATVVACVRPATDADEQLHVGDDGIGTPFAPTGTGWSVAVARVTAVGPLSLVLTTAGAAPTTLGRVGGDAASWAAWDDAAIPPDGRVPTATATPTGYVVDGGIAGTSALGGVHTGPDSPIGTLAIWATPGASRDSGTWFAAAVTASAGPAPVALDATRVRFETDDGEPAETALLSTASDGVVTLQWSPDAGGQAIVVASGIAIDRVIDLAAGVHVDDLTSGPAVPLLDAAPTTDAGEPLGEVARVPVATIAAGYLAIGGGEQWTGYASPDGRQQLMIGVRDAPIVEDTAIRLLLGPLGADDASIQREVHVGGLDVLSGSIDGQPELRVVRWRDGDRVITVLSRLPVAQIVDDLRGAHPATDDEWSALLNAALDWTGSVENQSTTIGAGVTARGAFWSVNLTDRFGSAQLRGGDTLAAAPLEPDPTRPVRVYRSVDTTFVLAVLPEPGDVAGLSVTIGDSTPQIVPLTASTSGLTSWAGAAYAFDATSEGDISIALVPA